MKIQVLVAAVALSVMTLAGCGNDPKVTDSPKTGSNASTSSSPDEDVATTETPAENPTFGETVTYENGLEITVKKPTPTQIGEYAAMEKKWNAYQAFEVVVVNGTGKNFDVSAMYFTMQSNDIEAEEIYDSENGFNGTPTTTLLDGRQSKFRVGFGVDNPKDMVLQIELGDFESEPTIYTS